MGEGEYSNPITFVTLAAGNHMPPVPDTPMGLTAMTVKTDSILLSWSPSEVANTVYVVSRSDSVPTDEGHDGRVGAKGLMLSNPATDPRFDRITAGVRGAIYEVYRGKESKTWIKDLVPGRSYGFRVEAMTDATDTVQPVASQFVRFDTSPTAPSRPDPPLLVQRSARQMKVQWARPLDGGRNVTGYVLTMSDGVAKQTFKIAPATVMNYTAVDLKPSSTYT